MSSLVFVPTDLYSLSLDGEKLLLVTCEFTNEPIPDADYHYFVNQDGGDYDRLEFNHIVEHHIFLSEKYPHKVFTIHFEGTIEKPVMQWLDDAIPF